MSPIEYIKEGILKGNWEIICEGYERLTGESLPLPIDRPGEVRIIKEALSQMIDIASLALGNQVEAMVIPTIKSAKRKPSRPKKHNNKTSKKSMAVTKDGEDASLQLNENDRTPTQKEVGGIHLITNEPDPEEIDRNKAKAARSNRNKLQINRAVSETYEVECNECQTLFESTRPDGEMGQKCKRCLNGLRSRFA